MRAPVAAAPVQPPVAATRMSPGRAIDSAANGARVSTGPQSPVTAGSTATRPRPRRRRPMTRSPKAPRCSTARSTHSSSGCARNASSRPPSGARGRRRLAPRDAPGSPCLAPDPLISLGSGGGDEFASACPGSPGRAWIFLIFPPIACLAPRAGSGSVRRGRRARRRLAPPAASPAGVTRTSRESPMTSVETRAEGPVFTIVMNRPDKRNAVDGPMAQALRAAFAVFEARDELRVAVLAGERRPFLRGRRSRRDRRSRAPARARSRRRRRRADGADPARACPSR